MTEPDAGDPMIDEEQPPAEQFYPASRRRLRMLPALAVASMLVAGGLLMAVGGMARVVGPAPATPTPTLMASPAPEVTPAPSPPPRIPPGSDPLGPTQPPQGEVWPWTGPV